MNYLVLGWLSIVLPARLSLILLNKGIQSKESDARDKPEASALAHAQQTNYWLSARVEWQAQAVNCTLNADSSLQLSTHVGPHQKALTFKLSAFSFSP